MAKQYAYFILCCVTIILILQPTINGFSCRCLSNNMTCWPNSSNWQIFNDSINGRLILPRPSAVACNKDEFNAQACIEAAFAWTNSMWRSYQVGAMQYTNWENSSCSLINPNATCNQGCVPLIAINATWSEHVQTTIKYAAKYNLRLVIKTTGHDMLGRSTAPGSLLLWLHYMKNMTLIEEYESCNSTNITNALRVSAGVQWGEVYPWLAQYNLTAIGGACDSVGVVGGYLQGGGHSPLSRWKGLAVDQVLEYDVVMADGQRQTVSPCQNGDLFWALSGGVGGTYAVVLSVVLKTFPIPCIIGTLQSIKAPNDTRYATLIRDFFRLLPTLADAGWAGYVTMVDNTISLKYLWPNGDFSIGNATFTEFLSNNTDLTLLASGISYIPSFYDAYQIAFYPSDPTGYSSLVGSRLIPETIVRSRPGDIAQVFLQMKGQTVNGSSLLINLVAGGAVSETMNRNNSVNPAWRTALLHVVYGQAWLDGLSTYDQKFVAANIASKMQILDTLSNGSLFGVYMNEADPNESNWQQRFFGSTNMYSQLKAIKNKVDPMGLFVCKNCVGSDDWATDLNCPKSSTPTSSSNTIKVNLALRFMLISILLLI